MLWKVLGVDLNRLNRWELGLAFAVLAHGRLEFAADPEFGSNLYEQGK
jgi:hypothetical protein